MSFICTYTCLYWCLRTKPHHKRVKGLNSLHNLFVRSLVWCVRENACIISCKKKNRLCVNPYFKCTRIFVLSFFFITYSFLRKFISDYIWKKLNNSWSSFKLIFSLELTKNSFFLLQLYGISTSTLCKTISTTQNCFFYFLIGFLFFFFSTKSLFNWFIYDHLIIFL